MPKPLAADRPRLTLEDYVLFFTTRTGQGLTLDQINQIIYMHAFIKLHRSTKPTMVDLLRSVNLMRPRRSTVSLNATAPPPRAAPAAAAVLSTEESTRDIEDLGWRECPVGSLLAIRAGRRAPAAAIGASPMPLASLAPSPRSTMERVSPPSLLSASSPLPPLLPAPARRKRSKTGKGKTATTTRKRRMVELLTLPSVEMATSD
ncbi:hypothetical protein EJB05_06899 [Eragrostis curvula]|uniref:DUF7787 domain-containing protein n=1 Tax=Eragrostis curvula TaxID=38414 RepID=A0A5J9WJ56_9POAL|nr:hypothetical protein EJB05_06899 [Eragrostis curvula]